MLVKPHQEEMVERNMVDMCTKRQMWILLILFCIFFLYLFLFLAVDPDPLTP